MDPIITTLKQLLETYASSGWRCRGYAMFDDERQTYGVNVLNFATDDEFMRTGIVIFVRVINEQIVIESDLTDKPLFEGLIKLGIPRQNIHLIYAGEPYPPEALPEEAIWEEVTPAS
jgi:hypothetical protein